MILPPDSTVCWNPKNRLAKKACDRHCDRCCFQSTLNASDIWLVLYEDQRTECGLYPYVAAFLMTSRHCAKRFLSVGSTRWALGPPQSHASNPLFPSWHEPDYEMKWFKIRPMCSTQTHAVRDPLTKTVMPWIRDVSLITRATSSWCSATPVMTLLAIQTQQTA